MESCKKLDFRRRDVSTKIPNSFNLVSDKLALGLQLLSFSLFLFSVAERKGACERIYFYISGSIIYTRMRAHLAWLIESPVHPWCDPREGR